jgi:excisionase family DNA binding protein
METKNVGQDKLQQIVEKAVEEAIVRSLPEAIRGAIMKEFFTVDELASYTGWSRRTIQYLRDTRRLPFYQDGKRIFFKYDEIEAYLQSKRVKLNEEGYEGSEGNHE